MNNIKWRLVEPCCGSAALTMHILGSKSNLLPYQGSKWKFRKEIEKEIRKKGFQGKPSEIILNDVSMWPEVLESIFSPVLVGFILKKLMNLNNQDPLQIYNSLHNNTVSASKSTRVAEFLFLQRLSFSGKAVGVSDGKWKSPGFNKTSAYGLAATNKFGKVNPMVPGLIKRIQNLPRTSCINIICSRLDAKALSIKDNIKTVVFLDPPYRSSTKYPDGDLNRKAVVKIAQEYFKKGFLVIISESEPIRELSGWESRIIYGGSRDASPFKGKQEEWLTISP